MVYCLYIFKFKLCPAFQDFFDFLYNSWETVWYALVSTLSLLTLIYSLFPWIYLPEITHFLTRLKSAHHKVRWFGNVIKKLLVLSISPSPCPFNCLLTYHGSTAQPDTDLYLVWLILYDVVKQNITVWSLLNSFYSNFVWFSCGV